MQQLWFLLFSRAGDVSLEKPWRRLAEFEADERPSRHGEEMVHFFQTTLFGLWHEEIYQHEHEDIESGEEAKSTRRGEGEEDARKCEAEDRSPEIDPGNGPAHANVAMGDGPYFGRVSKGDRSRTGTIANVEEVNE